MFTILSRLNTSLAHLPCKRLGRGFDAIRGRVNPKQIRFVLATAGSPGFALSSLSRRQDLSGYKTPSFKPVFKNQKTTTCPTLSPLQILNKLNIN
jgi:hypothetical protein